jgi:glycosyltransferase involved in cell wall biosynthesis
MVANLRPIKRVETLLEAATILRTKLTDFKIAIVGDGPLRDKLKQRADSLGLADCVKFLGSRTDIPTLLKSAKIGVLTSQSEGCSNAILEYMSTGLPVVATAVGGNLELVEDGSSGYLVAVADSEKLAQRLKELISNGELRQRMGKRGRQLVEQRYSLERMVAAHEDYYLSCFRDSS